MGTIRKNLPKNDSPKHHANSNLSSVTKYKYKQNEIDNNETRYEQFQKLYQERQNQIKERELIENKSNFEDHILSKRI